MSKFRMKAKVDRNQGEIVRQLRKIPGVSVSTGKDDLLVGHKGKTYWFEIKDPSCIGKDAEIRESAKKASQIKLQKEWTGHYQIVTSFDEIWQSISK